MILEDENDLMIGSYSEGLKKPSLYLYKPKSQFVTPVISTINPSYVLIRDPFIYFVCEHQKGEIITLNKNFDPIGILPTNGDDPCHISADSKGRYLTVTNYSTASFMVVALEKGIAKYSKFFIMHQGSSIDPDRQQTPHPHSSVFRPDSSVLYVADLGTDILYHYDISDDNISLSKQKSIKFEGGTGPRTVCLGAIGDDTLLLSCELNSTVRLLSYKKGPLQCLKTYKVSTYPSNFPSQVCYSNGLVYLANRGEDCLIVFNYLIDSLSQQYRFKVGVYPRHVLVVEDCIYVACNKEGTVYKYRKDDKKVYELSILKIAGASCVAAMK